MSGKSKYPPLHIALLLFSVTIIIANDNKWKVSSYSGDAPEAQRKRHLKNKKKYLIRPE